MENTDTIQWKAEIHQPEDRSGPMWGSDQLYVSHHLSPSSVGPVDVVVSPAWRPADPAVPDLSSSPEISLSVLGHQAQEVVLLVPAVQADRPHVVGPAEPLRLALGELGATQSPADKEVLSLKHTALV